MEEEKLEVINVEETELCSGKTITELFDELEFDKNMYEDEKHNQLVYSVLSGSACLLGFTLGTIISLSAFQQMEPLMVGAATVIVGQFSALPQIGAIPNLIKARKNYNNSFKELYDALKRQVELERINKPEEEVKEKSL